MTEAEFEQSYRDTLFLLEEAIDKAIEREDVDLDYETVNDILTVECPDDSAIIITKQSATHQLWLAAKSGGFHFDFDASSKQWVCTTQDKTLFPMLESIIVQQANIVLKF